MKGLLKQLSSKLVLNFSLFYKFLCSKTFNMVDNVDDLKKKNVKIFLDGRPSAIILNARNKTIRKLFIGERDNIF